MLAFYKRPCALGQHEGFTGGRVRSSRFGLGRGANVFPTGQAARDIKTGVSQRTLGFLYFRPTSNLRIFKQGQKMTLNYSLSVAALGFTPYLSVVKKKVLFLTSIYY